MKFENLKSLFDYPHLLLYEEATIFLVIASLIIFARPIITRGVKKLLHLLPPRLNFEAHLLDFCISPIVFCLSVILLFIDYKIFLSDYHDSLNFTIKKLLDISTVIALTWLFFNFLDFFIPNFVKTKKGQIDHIFNNNIFVFVLKTSRITVGAIAIVIILQIFGINLLGLLAGLGLVGIAFALAAQDTLKNFLSSVTMILDNVFVEGDHIKIDNVEGVIEYIGFRSTTIRTNDNSLVFVPNGKFSDSIVVNVSKIPFSNIDLVVTLSRPITKEVVNKIIDDIRAFNAQHDYFDQTQAIISTKSLNNNEIAILCQFIIKTTDSNFALHLKSDAIEEIANIVLNNKAQLVSILADEDHRKN
jgi:MscS family membrane protein